MAQISVRNLNFAYEGSFDNVFDNVSFSIDTNWKLGFIGRNGKGKPWLNNEVEQELKNHKLAPKKLERFKELTPEHFDINGLKFMYKIINKTSSRRGKESRRRRKTSSRRGEKSRRRKISYRRGKKRRTDKIRRKTY